MHVAILWPLIVLAPPAAPLPSGHVVWLEAEALAEHGGWTLDSQFIDQMGSPYLMAIGLGTPVADARATIALPQPGRYRLWARTRDWVPEHHPGRFQIVLGGRTVAHVFGESGKSGWHWEDGGACELAGKVELHLHDLTGYYARCDALVLTEDLTWTPPADKEAMCRLRERFGGLSRAVTDLPEQDVVVVGGGLAGCMAAVSAARLGARTVLVQNRPVLGGNASTEILVPPVGVWPHAKLDPLDPRETGLVEEIRTEGNQRTDEAKLYAARLKRLVEAEPNLRTLLETHVSRVQMQSAGTIGAVVALQVRTGQRVRIPGRVFIDCTGDAVVGVAAGAEYRHGREARAMHDEPMAPEQGDRKTMGNSLKYVSVPGDGPQPFATPAWATAFPRCESFMPQRHPRLGRDIEWQWMIELGGMRDTYHDAEEIRDELLRLMYGMWDHVKNRCPDLKAKAANHKLAWVGHVAGKRESRRLIGDCVLTENDIARQTLFPDRVAYGAWCVDDHPPEGFFYHGPPSRCAYFSLPFSIPFRSLYSNSVENLLMAGRDISASHLAMADTRVMLTCAVLGQAAGTAAALCVDPQLTPRELGRSRLESLQQQLLKDGAYLIGMPNRDPRDLARSASAQASSERRLPSGEVMGAAEVLDGYARAEGSKPHAWGPDPKAALPQWIELAWQGPQTFNMVHVAFSTKRHAPRRFALQTASDSLWRTVSEVADNRHRRHVLGIPGTTTSKLRLVLLEPGENEVGVCEIRVYDEPPRVLEIAARAARNRDLPDPPPALPWDDSTAWISGLDPKKLTGIVLDDRRAERTGHWVTSTHTEPFVGEGYIHDGNAGKGQKSVRFRLRVPEAGKYELRLGYQAFGNRATRVPVTVVTPSGQHTLHVNQRETPPINGLFRSLGTANLARGGKVEVIVANAETDGYVVVDAVQMVPLQP